MYISNQLRQLRNSLSLSRDAFGSRLGVSQDVINNWERGRVETPEAMIKLICMVYKVNDTWLRHGTGQMMQAQESIDSYAEANGATGTDIAIIKAFLTLEPDIRRKLIQHFKDAFVDVKKDKPVQDIAYRIAADNGDNVNHVPPRTT